MTYKIKINLLRYPTGDDWARALRLARETQGKEGEEIVPSLEWKRKLIRSEHSPLRTLMFTIEMQNIPYYSSVHFVRHKIGVEHYVRSQRVNPDRGAERQDAPVNHIMDINAQALIQMARMRLCYKADPMTRLIMVKIVDKVERACPEFVGAFLPKCGCDGDRCMEFKPCGRYNKHDAEIYAYPQ